MLISDEDALLLHPLRVLLAEDQDVNRRLLLLMLERLGMTADTASNGLEALTLLEQSPYDLVLMDIRMPELNGMEATRRIRSRTEMHQPIIIAMTADDGLLHQAECLASGMDDCMSKPIHLIALRDKLVTWARSIQQVAWHSMEAGATARMEAPDRKDVSTAWEQDLLLEGDAIQELRQLQNEEPELTNSMLLAFFQQNQLRLQDLEDYGESEERSMLLEVLHQMKGASVNFGASQLARICDALHEAVQQADWPLVMKLSRDARCIACDTEEAMRETFGLS